MLPRFPTRLAVAPIFASLLALLGSNATVLGQCNYLVREEKRVASNFGLQIDLSPLGIGNTFTSASLMSTGDVGSLMNATGVSGSEEECCMPKLPPMATDSDAWKVDGPLAASVAFTDTKAVRADMSPWGIADASTYVLASYHSGGASIDIINDANVLEDSVSRSGCPCDAHFYNGSAYVESALEMVVNTDAQDGVQLSVRIDTNTSSSASLSNTGTGCVDISCIDDAESLSLSHGFVLVIRAYSGASLVQTVARSGTITMTDGIRNLLLGDYASPAAYEVTEAHQDYVDCNSDPDGGFYDGFQFYSWPGVPNNGHPSDPFWLIQHNIAGNITRVEISFYQTINAG